MSVRPWLEARTAEAAAATAAAAALRDQHAEAITALRAKAQHDADERVTAAVAEAAAAASLAARDELGEEIARLEATCEALEAGAYTRPLLSSY
jgi:hypothetical protein